MNPKSTYYWLTILLLAAIRPLVAQVPAAGLPKPAILGALGYGVQIPEGDLAERFGPHFRLDGSLEWKTGASNLYVGLQGGFLFGNQVREDVLAGLRTPEGFIIGNDRSPADVQLRMRGLSVMLNAGKIIPLASRHPDAGIKAGVGAGLLQHKIRIQEDPVSIVPQIRHDYQKGYDRLSNGLALSASAGYQHLSADGRINFYAGLSFTTAAVRNRRSFDFAAGQQDTRQRQDQFLAFRLAWILPFYLSASETIYY